MQPENVKSNPGMEPWRQPDVLLVFHGPWPTHYTRAQRHSRVGRTLCRPGLASQDGFHRLPSDVAASWPCPDGDKAKSNDCRTLHWGWDINQAILLKRGRVCSETWHEKESDLCLSHANHEKRDRPGASQSIRSTAPPPTPSSGGTIPRASETVPANRSEWGGPQCRGVWEELRPARPPPHPLPLYPCLCPAPWRKGGPSSSQCLKSKNFTELHRISITPSKFIVGSP